MKNHFSAWLASALACLTLPAAAHNAVLTHAGHTFSYQESLETAEGDLQGEVIGVIHVTREDGLVSIYQEKTALRPGCGDEPGAEYVGGDFVALCGHLGGRHYTKTLFRLTPEPAPVAQLDYYDNPAPIGIDRHGFLRTRVLRRDVFPGVTGPVYFPFVYVLDGAADKPAFRRDFSVTARPLYLDYYEALKREGRPRVHYRAMAAALVAAADTVFACRELRALQKALPASVDLPGWLRTLPRAGYPGFELAGCKG
ncbi:hypothetical protein [Pseudoduganella armeniaca]|uniref:Uncharacterized protein n=1 Tax=Pseudoduganella armeniaca TaxID=2072590 RepID=A0A2R4C5Z9_9BURK|nr:hypothetical protein [Pseudoduganella armeniaca]AVR94982.1 hypothetical protein C9I28_04070 [Pseudoduganella armeniaca]